LIEDEGRLVKLAAQKHAPGKANGALLGIPANPDRIDQSPAS
jgi:hypothetical protein